jgi:hypothetical protein
MQTEAQKPQDQKHHENGPKHSHVLCSSLSTTRRTRPARNQPTVFGITQGLTDQDCSHGGSVKLIDPDKPARIVHANYLSKTIGRGKPYA